MRARVLQNPPLEGKASITTHGPTGKMSAVRLDRTCLHVVQAPRQGPGPAPGCQVCVRVCWCNTLKQNEYGLHKVQNQTQGRGVGFWPFMCVRM